MVYTAAHDARLYPIDRARPVAAVEASRRVHARRTCSCLASSIINHQQYLSTQSQNNFNKTQATSPTPTPAPTHPQAMAAAARRLTEAVKLLLAEDYAKLDKRVPHLLDRLRERGADYCWHKVRVCLSVVCLPSINRSDRSNRAPAAAAVLTQAARHNQIAHPTHSTAPSSSTCWACGRF